MNEMRENEVRIYTMVVKNRPGVLDRIAGLIRRCGLNIAGIVARELEGTEETSITMTLRCAGETMLPDKKLRELDFMKSFMVRSERGKAV